MSPLTVPLSKSILTGLGLQKKEPQAIGKSVGGWTTKLHMVAASERLAVAFMLSGGNQNDAPEGRKLLGILGNFLGKCSVIMDRAYEGDETRKAVRKLGYKPVVPPKKNRVVPWKYSKKMYKKRNEVERLFRNLKEFRRIFTRYDKLDDMFMGFITFGLVIMGLKHGG
jgi:transposase